MSVYSSLMNGESKLCIIGLGYVGLPLAVEFSKYLNVIGYDIDFEKVQKYKEQINNKKLYFTNDDTEISEAKFYIVTVPTPVYDNNTPDFSFLVDASRTIGRYMKKGSVVVYESTVYPGITENLLLQILEKESQMRCGKDFFVGYSPERINPGDNKYHVSNITKIVSAIDDYTLKEVRKVYEIIIKEDVYPVSNIKVAEAVKLSENVQRDVNIALLNEMSKIYHKLEIDSKEVIDAMNTKWNALGFYPGLVGGHCIGIDSYYYINLAKKIKESSQIVEVSRSVNDSIPDYIIKSTIKKLIQENVNIKSANILIMGITFKENCNDIRNSKVLDIINILKEYSINPIVVDDIVDKQLVKKLYNIDILNIEDVKDIDCIIAAVKHKEFSDLSLEQLNSMYRNKNRRILVDVKGMFDTKQMEQEGYVYWRL